MVFSSPIFLFLFLPVTLILAYLSFRFRWRNSVLLLLSMFFYAFGEGEMLIVMFASIVMNYFVGIWVEKDRTLKAISIGIVLNLALLVVYKYTDFIITNINLLVVSMGGNPIPLTGIKLPAGISFYTFHSVSYLMDVYRKKSVPQKSFVDLALYICLFPQLIAGPIVRYNDIDKQLSRRKLNIGKIHAGLERFIIGLGKKVIIANTLGTCADMVFSVNPVSLTSATAWFGLLCYSMQLYFDFSGYSDMAIGLGQMLGFNFLENFRFPYISQSIKEFWRRWHISLSNWFRDYLYIPLGGNRVSKGRMYVNLCIVFFLTGLWHGASWNFVIWGLIHGLFLVIERLGFETTLSRLPWIIRRLYMMLVVIIAWVFFRSDDLHHSMGFLKAMFAGGMDRVFSLNFVTNPEVIFAFIIGAIMCVNGFTWMLRKIFKASLATHSGRQIVKPVFRWSRQIFFFIVLVWSALSVAAGSYNPFIYFRF